MQVCLFTKYKNIEDLMISELLFFGVTVVAAKDLKETDLIITENIMNCLILDVDGQEESCLNYIEALKNDIKTSSLFVIILTSHQEEEMIHRYILEGISGICHKEENINQYVNSIKSIIEILEKETERRQFIRIQPSPDEGLSVKIKSGNKEIICIIKDISVIAAAIVIQDQEFFNQIHSEFHIKNLPFQILGKEYICDVLIMRKSVELRRKEDILVIGFQNPSADFKYGLANYLYQKIKLS